MFYFSQNVGKTLKKKLKKVFKKLKKYIKKSFDVDEMFKKCHVIITNLKN